MQQEFISFAQVKARLAVNGTHTVWGALGCVVEMRGQAHTSLDLAAAAAPQDGLCQAEIQQLQDHLEQPPGEPLTCSLDGAPLGL